MSLRAAVISTSLCLAAAAALPASAAAASTTTVGVDGGQLTVEGGAERDYVDISASEAAGCPGGAPCYQVSNGGAANTVVPAPPCVAFAPFPGHEAALCPSSGIARIVVGGHEGREYIDLEPLGALEVPLTARGDRGRDHIEGTARGDLLIGGTDRDSIDAAKGRDRVSGGDGNDHLNGDQGNDVVIGGPGDDNVFGTQGADRLLGGAGRDFMGGGIGPDVLFGGADPDYVSGASGIDRCNGGDDPRKQNDRPFSCETFINFP